ncbi:MAG: arsenate reductase ArsC [Chlorobi bacterium]|nr:arsenate reductase ArsC [Chlorobiota bacterium]
MNRTPRILILCTGNSCRSQMAQGFLRQFLPGATVYSAGTEPSERVHPLAVEVMREAGIDISAHRPESVERYVEMPFDYVITVCDDAREKCPVFTGEVRHRLHRSFDDPAAFQVPYVRKIAFFRRVRDEIKAFCWDLAEGILN